MNSGAKENAGAFAAQPAGGEAGCLASVANDNEKTKSSQGDAASDSWPGACRVQRCLHITERILPRYRFGVKPRRTNGARSTAMA